MEICIHVHVVCLSQCGYWRRNEYRHWLNTTRGMYIIQLYTCKKTQQGYPTTTLTLPYYSTLLVRFPGLRSTCTQTCIRIGTTKVSCLFEVSLFLEGGREGERRCPDSRNPLKICSFYTEVHSHLHMINRVLPFKVSGILLS